MQKKTSKSLSIMDAMATQQFLRRNFAANSNLPLHKPAVTPRSALARAASMETAQPPRTAQLPKVA